MPENMVEKLLTDAADLAHGLDSPIQSSIGTIIASDSHSCCDTLCSVNWRVVHLPAVRLIV
jgi:hypothetical protein